MSLSKRMLLLAASFIVGSAMASAASISFTPVPGSANCAVQTWGCETTGTPTFGAGGVWQVTSGNIDFVNSSYWNFVPSGDYVIDLSGSNLGTISTTLTGLTVGQSYVLSFSYTYNPDNSINSTRSASVNLSNAGGFNFTLGPFTNTTNGQYGTANSGPAWSTFSQAFTATASTATLTFASLTNQYQGIVLKNDIAYAANNAVPEPATLAIVGAGLLLVGLKRYRKA